MAFNTIHIHLKYRGINKPFFCPILAYNGYGPSDKSNISNALYFAFNSLQDTFTSFLTYTLIIVSQSVTSLSIP